METLDLTKILAGCPKGTPLFSTIHGEVQLREVDKGSSFPIVVKIGAGESCIRFTYDGRFYDMYRDAECVLFPSKNCRDWSQFKKPQTDFQKGDHILWRGEDGEFLGVFAEYAIDGKRCKAVLFQGERSALFDVFAKDLTKVEKFDPKLLHTGDAVLVRDGKDDEWSYTDFSHLTKSPERQFCACGTYWRMCVPYNQETKHLIGTCYKAPEFYDLTDK